MAIERIDLTTRAGQPSSSRYFEVWTADGVQISRHTSDIEALQSMTNYILANGGECELRRPITVAKGYGVLAPGSGTDTASPSAPTAVSGSAVSATSISLTWTESTDNIAVTGYQVFRGGVPVSTVTAPPFVDEGLSPSTQYSYTVAAYDAAGNNSEVSAAALVTTSPNAAPAWSGLASQTLENGSAVNLALDSYCTDADSDSITYSLVSGALPTGLSLSGARNESLGGTVTTDGSYAFVLGASDGIAAVQTLSLTFTVETPDTTAPNAPSAPTVDSYSSSYIQLNLPTSAAPDHASYTVQRSTNGVNYGTRATGVTSSTWMDSGLGVSTTYYYRLLDVDTSGNISSPGSSVSQTTASNSSVSSATLRSAGYILATDYSGVDPTGTTDSWQGLHNALVAATNARKPLWLPSGTYLVSDTLRVHAFSRNQGNYDMAGCLIGATYPSRPVIKASPSTNKFDSSFSGNAGFNRRPVVDVNYFVPATGTNVAPPTDRTSWHPYVSSFTSDGTTWTPQCNIMFCAIMWNIEIDTSGKSGADGLNAALAQRCTFGKIKIRATGSNIGLLGGSGRASPLVDVEVIGGRYGISTELAAAQVPKGTSYNGVKLSGQTVAGFYSREAGVMTVVGLEATLNNIPLIVYDGSTSQPSSGSAVFVDGKVTCTNYGASTWVFDNTLQKTTYIRNIYVTGTNNLLRTSSTQVTGSGTWKLINELCVNDLRGVEYPASLDETNLAVKSMINGTVSQTLVPVSSVSNSVSAPTVDYVARHICTPEMIDSGLYVDVTAYFAAHGGNASGTADCAAAFDAAIAAAEAAGHNRVLVPSGQFAVSRTIVLRQHTKLVGINCATDFVWGDFVRSRILALSTWLPTTRQYIIQTPNSASSTCRLDWIGVYTNSGSDNAYNLWCVNWRSGSGSGSIGTVIKQQYEASSTRPPRALWHFTGNGGGSHYGLETNGSQARSGGWFLLMEGTSQPARFYGNQLEVTKNAPVADSNIKVSGCSNIRFYAIKREGISPTIKIENSSNIAWYGASSMRGPVNPGYHYISGTSSNILTAVVMVERAADPVVVTRYTVQENITAGNRGIRWPESAALQKLGTIDDSAVFI